MSVLTCEREPRQLGFAFGETIEQRFERFHADNPRVYKLLVSLAREKRAQGYRRYWIARLFEQLLWGESLCLNRREPLKLNGPLQAPLR